jgi:hypothetical protein
MTKSYGGKAIDRSFLKFLKLDDLSCVDDDKSDFELNFLNMSKSRAITVDDC